MSAKRQERRRASRSGGRNAAAALRSWRVLLFGAALLMTFYTMQRYMSTNHAEHVSKGITRRQLPEESGTSGALRASADSTDSARNDTSQRLRGKQQAKQPQTTGSGFDTAGGSYARACSVQEHAEYTGDVVKWGTDHIMVRSPSAVSGFKQRTKIVP